MRIQRFVFIVTGMLYVSSVAGIDKYVHMDLKGAPLKPEFFKQMLEVFAKLGATGVVIEWEDMFPLTGILASASHGNAYSKSDVVGILETASRLNLTVVPLVQTLGHAEWILKTALFSPLRQNESYPNVFCIGNEAVTEILGDLLSQVAGLHAAVAPLPFFHIGADEALIKPGQCEEDKEKMEELGTNDTKILTYNHLRTMAKVVQDEYPDTMILAWFDEFKYQEAGPIREFELSERIIPVVWKYWATNLDGALPEDMWANLSDAFPTAWGGSAFKGANGASQIDNAITPYLANNQLWRDQVDKYSDYFNDSIGAVIITGWQRYDHFTGLCELLPTSMTSLALSMIMLENGNVTDSDAASISQQLSCPRGTTLVTLLQGGDSCLYPGNEVRTAIRKLQRLFLDYDKYTYIHNLENGWFGRYQREKNFGSRYYIESLHNQYSKFAKKLDLVIEVLNLTMSAVYFPETAAEFIFDRAGEFREKLEGGLKIMDKMEQRMVFPVRPIF